MLKKLGYAVLYSLFGTATYFLFFYLTFPSDVAADRIRYEANRAGVRLQLEDFKPAFPFGISLSGVDFYGFADAKSAKPRRAAKLDPEGPPPIVPGIPPGVDAPFPGAEAESGATESTTSAAPIDPPMLSLDSVTVSNLLPLVPGLGQLFGDVSFDAELYGGELEGSYRSSEESTHLLLDITELDLSRYPFKTEDYELSMAGKFGLNTDLTINKTTVRDSAGSMALLFNGFTLRKGTKFKGVELPVEMAFAYSGGKAEVKNGRAELEETKFESKPLTVILSGSIMLNKDLSKTRFNLKVALKFGEELQIVSAFLPSNARSEDGFFHYVITGYLDKLRTRPDRLAARRGGRPTPGERPSIVGGGAREDLSDGESEPGIPRPRGIPGMPGITGMEPGDFSSRAPVADDAERERLREERRKRAEERRKKRDELRAQRIKQIQNGEGGPEEMRNAPMPPDNYSPDQDPGIRVPDIIDEPGMDPDPNQPDYDLPIDEAM